MSSQAGSLKKAPLCAETLEKLCMTELNIVNITIQTTKKDSSWLQGLGKALPPKKSL